MNKEKVPTFFMYQSSADSEFQRGAIGSPKNNRLVLMFLGKWGKQYTLPFMFSGELTRQISIS